MFDHVTKTMVKIQHLPPDRREAVERNVRRGLLCACNATLIPYYDANGEEHGTRKIGHTVHGYDHCTRER